MARLPSPYQNLSQYMESVPLTEAQGIEAVDSSRIVQTVMGEVSSAETSIQMTMDVAEELASPLPPAYHQLLTDRLHSGVSITRLGFGTQEEFQQVSSQHSFDSPNFNFFHNSHFQEYQRMILIDGNVLCFRVGGTFFRTSNPELIAQFQDYFRHSIPTTTS